MNLTKLFETQKILRDRINYQGEDRFEKIVLALLVELGELCQEWRGFKFWSTDQEPRREAKRQGKTASGLPARHIEIYNPLLEEFADGIHFILEMMIETEFELDDWVIDKITTKDITTQFIKINQSVTDLWELPSETKIAIVLEYYLGLGEMLGFTQEQIESAYYAKNKINHQRQESGY